MDRLRTVAEWIAAHKYLSFVIAIFVVAGIFVARVILRSYDGDLSQPVKRGQILEAVYGIGTVVPYKRLSLNPLIGNTVSKSFVREGDRVKKGEPLVRTESGTIHYAPFDGVVSFFPYRTGENTYATTPMFVFTGIADRYVVVSMEQQGALKVKVGQTAKISFDSLRDKTFEGTVSAVYSYNSNFLARIDSINLPASVLPDMTCDVAIVVNSHDDALLVPTAAFEDGRVWIKRTHSIPRAVPVKLGIVDSEWAEIIGGDVHEGDQVMIRHQVLQ